MGQGSGSALMNLDDLVVKLKDNELAGFPNMSEGVCGINGNFLSCATNGKFRLNIMLPEGEICPRCGVYLKKAQ